MSDVDKLMTEILGWRPNVKDKALRELVMARMKAGGEVKAAGGGFVRKAMKAIQKAADSADVKMTPATKDLTTMQDTHTNLMDSVRDRAAQMRKVMEGFEYKYKPGEHVFTESKSKKPLPPWKIVDRQLSGNMVMREPVPPGAPALMGKIVRDPETGKPLRTPYEPAYKVRREYGPDDWEETIIPESGILGRLDPDEPYAKGGLIKSLVKAIAKELPEAKASQKTQIRGTEPTYRKAYDILEREKPGGMGIVTTRGRDVLNAAGEAGPEPMSKITSIGTYQKGFSPEELREYLTYMLGKDYDISRLNLGPAGAVLRKKEKGKAKAWAESRKGQGRDPFATSEDLRMPVPDYAKGGEVKAQDGGVMGSGITRGLAGMNRPSGDRRRERPNVPSQSELQAMFLDVPAGLGVPFAEAGSYALRGETDEAKESAAIEAALIGVPGAAVLAKPAYRAVKKGVQKAAPAVREAARGALESSMESGLIQGPLYAVKPSGGQWLGGRKVDPQQIGVPNAPAPIDPETIRSYKERLDESRQRLQEYQEMTGMEPTQEMADRVRNLERGVEGIERGEAVRRWVDSNLDNYVRKQMGTPDDPVRKLADQGILHMPQLDVTLMKLVANQREAAGFPREGFATTDLGRMWETLTDSGIKQIEAGKLRDPEYMLDIGRRFRDEEKNFGRPGAIPEENRLTAQQASEVRNFASATTARGWDSLMRNNPWLEKVDLETPIYSVSRWMKDNVSRSLGFDHIVDVLKADLASGRMRPEQLSKMSMEQAVRRTNEYDVERAAAMAKAAEEETAGLTVAKTFEDGFKIVKLDKPGQFAKESDRMGHSVRGYEPERGSKEWSEASGVEGSSLYGHGGWDAIKSGNAQVFSIRDAKNQPHVTIEVSREADPSMNEMQRFIDSIEDPAVRETVERRLQYTQTSGDYSDPEWRMATILRYGGREGPDGQWVEGAIPGYKEFKESIPERITQIKGKQNRKPDEKYLPYVQKFIREGNYKVEGDLSNTELVDTKNLSQYAYKTSDLGLNYDEFKKMLNLSKDIPRYITESELLRTAKTGKFEPEFKKGGKVKTKRSALSSLERAK